MESIKINWKENILYLVIGLAAIDLPSFGIGLLLRHFLGLAGFIIGFAGASIGMAALFNYIFVEANVSLGLTKDEGL